jgi:hypothetical protein
LLVFVAGCQVVAGLSEPLPSPPAPPADAAAVDPYAQLVLSDKPVAYFKLDETSGRKAADATGNGNDATLAGSFRLEDGLHFDDNGATMIVGDRLDFPGDAPFTFEMWIRTDGKVAGRIFSKILPGTTAGPRGTHLVMAPVGQEFRLLFQRFNADGVLRAACHDESGPLDDGQLHHLVVTSDGPSVYVDGLHIRDFQPGRFPCFDKPEVSGVADNDASLTFGGFVGFIDDVAIYDHALSRERITEHFRTRRGP